MLLILTSFYLIFFSYSLRTAIEHIILQNNNHQFVGDEVVSAMLQYTEELSNISNYGHEIIPFARKAIDRNHLNDIELIWNEKFSVKTAETITKLVLGRSFNVVPSHEMFEVSRFV